MIVQAVANSFKLEILQGVHQPSDEYRIALYTSAAVLNENTTAYLQAGEVNGDGYKPGGQTLTGYRAMQDGRVSFLDWDNPMWPLSSITARGALIFNLSKENRAVAVIDLGRDFTSTNGSFAITFPEPTAQTALVRIG